MELDSLCDVDSSDINDCGSHESGKICLVYPILWDSSEARPDIAVNEAIQPPSQ
jgi:hypothetical protein